MILILSIAQDNSTSNVIEWLLCKNLTFDRLHFEDFQFANINLSSQKTDIRIYNRKTYNLTNYKHFWYRRGNVSLPYKQFKSEESEFKKVINKFNLDEMQAVQSFIHSFLAEKKSINGYNDIFLNKLTVLNEAQKIGLLVPNTILTSSKETLKSFIKTHQKIITKAIYSGFSFMVDTCEFYLHTLLLEEKDVEDFPNEFAITKFQECIEKAYELRIFYLNGKFYSSAIFSQNDEKTKVDFRNYNNEKPNRVLPYILPKEIALKLRNLMKQLKLASGSIDMIVTKENNYVFLEVNPIGQFTQVSAPCNYYLEEKIADYLN
jgi:ATP-GRASP peptide maturase of grasp-with-spasm system